MDYETDTHEANKFKWIKLVGRRCRPMDGQGTTRVNNTEKNGHHHL